MVAIDIKMPKNCVECDNMGLRYSLGCELIFNGCANCGRHPNCPLVEIVTCKDCSIGGRECSNSGKYCFHIGKITEDDFYCADGERRDSE